MPPFRILSVDGGGLKGYIAIRILRIIEEITGKRTTDQFGLLAGTSTGGLICSALVTPKNGVPRYDLDHIEQMYIEVGQTIFSQGGLTGRETQRLEALLQKTFGEAALSGTLLPLFVPTYEARSRKIIVFKTRSAIADKTKDVALKHVCRATSAIAPVFPPHRVQYHGREIECMDAGLHLKNPALSALAEVWKHRKYYGAGSEKDIVLVSVSTGTSYGQGADWTTDIHDIVGTQVHDMSYIREQKLKIDLSSIRFIRVDMRLEGSTFSFEGMLEWMARLNDLGRNKDFRADILKTMG